MKRLTLLLMTLMVLLSVPVLAAAVEVAEGVVASAVIDRAPVGAADSFSPEVGRLYCFTRITGGDEGSHVTHVWIKDGREMARVQLAVRSNDWRTWSSKAVMPEWSGAWQVDVLDDAGALLKSVIFAVK